MKWFIKPNDYQNDKVIIPQKCPCREVYLINRSEVCNLKSAFKLQNEYTYINFITLFSSSDIEGIREYRIRNTNSQKSNNLE